MTERNRPLPGIVKLKEMETRARYSAMRRQTIVNYPGASSQEDSFDPYIHFDDRKTRKAMNEVISNYVDTINDNQRKKSDIYAQWHRQDDGRLSKNIRNRQKVIAKQFWEKTLK